MEAIVSVSDELVSSNNSLGEEVDGSHAQGVKKKKKMKIKNALLDNQSNNDPLAKRLDPAFFEMRQIAKNSLLQERSAQLESEIQCILNMSPIKVAASAA